MTVSEKVAYLKGLAEGIGLDTESKEGKIISVIIDTLEDIALELADLSENALAIGDELDAISDDLSDVEEVVFGEDDDDMECDCCCDDDDDDDNDDDDDYEFCVTCPSCGKEIEIDEDDIVEGEITCPECGEKLEFDIEDENEDGD